MRLKDTLEQLGVADSVEALEAHWERSQRELPAADIEFLTPDYVRWACAQACLSHETTEATVAAARRIAADAALRAVAWHCHYCLFHIDGHRPPVHQWPVLTAALGPDAGLLNMLLLLSGTPQMQAVHRERGIPADVARATVLDLRLHLETVDPHEHVVERGISPRILNWHMNHWRGELYRLGRLQFVPDTSRARLRVFRHRGEGTVVALSEPGVRYRADGQMDGAGGVHDPAGAWTSTLTVSDDEIAGCPIDPTGHAVDTPLRLPREAWREELAPGGPVLAMHIPGGEPMAYEACGESVRRALAFFPSHFPDRPFAALMCHSWILDHQFEALLPPSSNLVRFQREVYLFPIQGASEGTLRSVFGRDYEDIATAPRETTMQRAFARHVEGGGHFRGGGCLLLPADVAWGSQVYRRQRRLW